MSKTECPECQRIRKQLQIQKADYQFEIKKIQEDKSTEKAMYEIHLQKEVRRWQENYNKQQSQRVDESRNWLIKYDTTVSSFETQIVTLNEDHKTTLKQEQSRLQTESSNKFSNMVHSYEIKLQELSKSHSSFISDLTGRHEKQIRNLLSKQESTIDKLKKTHAAILDEKIKWFESRIVGLQSQNVKECEFHRKTKKQAQDVQGRLYQEMFGLKKKLIQEEGKIEQLKKQIETKKSTIQQLQNNLTSACEQNEFKLRTKQQQYETALEKQQEIFKDKIKEVYEDTMRYCKKFEGSIMKMDEARVSQKEIYVNTLNQIKQSIDNRMSKPEDLEEIQNLRTCLVKKGKQCDMLNEELKWFRLELENKEETYNKIFLPANSNENMKKKEFKLRRQGRSVTTVREILQSINSNNLEKKGTPLIPKSKVL